MKIVYLENFQQFQTNIKTSLEKQTVLYIKTLKNLKAVKSFKRTPRVSSFNVNRLSLRVIIKTLLAQLPTNSAVFVASKRYYSREEVKRVDVAGSSF